MRIAAGTEAVEMIERIARRGQGSGPVELQAQRIVKNVRRDGDAALRRYAERWDGLQPDHALRVSQAEIADARKSLSRELSRSLAQAARNIRRFCTLQKPRSWTRNRKGISIGQVVNPLDSACSPVPGGRRP